MSTLSLTVMTEEEIRKTHADTINLLETTGFTILHEETLARFSALGAMVDEHSGNIKLPASLTRELLSLASGEAAAGSLSGRRLTIGGDNVYYTSLILDPFVVDWDDGVRKPNLSDVKRNTIIGESLERVSIMMRMQYPVTDVPGPDSYYRSMETFLLNMTKHVSAYPDNVDNCRDWVEVMELIADAGGINREETSPLSIAMAVLSPLTINHANIEIMKMAIETHAPILSTVCPMAGSTSPYSIAGTFLQANIEALLPVLVTQVYKPGHPALYAMGPSVTDMRSGRDLYYRAEKMLFKVMANQMSRFYGLPSSGEAGGSLTHLPDIQNGAESIGFLLAAHTGKQNIIGGLGSFGNANGMSSEQIIMQCGLVDMAEYLTRGVDFSYPLNGAGSIANTGPGENYLTDSLTISMLRDKKEFFSSPFMDLTGISHEKTGEGGGSAKVGGMHEIAHQKVLDLTTGFHSKVPGNVRESIKRYFFDKYQDKGVSNMD